MSITEFKAWGYTKYAKFFDKDYVDSVNSLLDKISAEVKPSETVFFEEGLKPKQIQYLMNYDKLFEDMIEKIRPLAQELTGEKELDVLNMTMIEKHPQISKPTRSHQDNAYFKVTPPIAITFWISLDYINDENGTLYYTPSSHLQPTIKHGRYSTNTTFRVRSGVPGLSMCIHGHDDSNDVMMETEPGDILVHNCNTIHKAGKNNTRDKRRRIIGLSFIPKICKIDNRLQSYFEEQLREDIELQKNNNIELYQTLINKFE